MSSNSISCKKGFPAVHYGWYVMATGTLCLFASLGLGRFSLGVLLPSMGRALQLSYLQMGLIGTVNFVGYLIAVLLCGRLTRRFGARRLIGTALIQEKGFSEAVAGNFWSWVGLLSLFSGPVIGIFSDRFGRRPALMLVFAIQAGAERVAAIFGFITFIFGLGQVIGPFLAGLLAETTGSFASSFLMAAFLALTAVFLSAFLPKKQH